MAGSGTTMSVNDSPVTRASLLVHRTGNRAAWQEFMKLYGPLVYGFARKLRLAGRRRSRPEEVMHSCLRLADRIHPTRELRLALHDYAQQSLYLPFDEAKSSSSCWRLYDCPHT